LKVVKYLYLLPVSFLFSAILTESLFLLLMLLSVYMARKRRWLYAGVFGFFLSLTRPFGILIIVALIIEYFEALKYKFRQIRPNVLFLLLPIAGIISFSIFNHYLVGDYFGFIHAEVLWGNILSNPIQTLILNILDGWRAPAIYSLIILFLIFYSLNKIRFSYWITSFLLFVIPLSFGLSSIFRYTVVIFPLCFILAGIGSSRAFDRCLTIILIILEVYLFIAWQIGSPLVI
jgi:Gpi18-like mannosyltransferase